MLYSSDVKVTPGPPVSCTQLKSLRLVTSAEGRELSCSTLHISVAWSNHTIAILCLLNTAWSLKISQDSARAKDSLSAEFFPLFCYNEKTQLYTCTQENRNMDKLSGPMQTVHLLQTIKNYSHIYMNRNRSEVKEERGSSKSSYLPP